jgi:hypothetical protein
VSLVTFFGSCEPIYEPNILRHHVLRTPSCAPGASGRGYAGFHAVVNFALTEFYDVHIHDPAHPCSNSCNHYTAPISDAPSATRRPSSAVWPMSACRRDKATLEAPATLRDFVGARYGVVLTSSHRSLRRRWHTLCEGRPKRKLSRAASAEARARVAVCEIKGQR